MKTKRSARRSSIEILAAFALAFIGAITGKLYYTFDDVMTQGAVNAVVIWCIFLLCWLLLVAGWLLFRTLWVYVQMWRSHLRQQ